MQKFDKEKAVIALELQQVISEFGYAVDVNGSRNITDFYHEDGVFVVGEQVFKSHTELRNFYAYRGELAQTEHTGGVRTARHTFTNFRYAMRTTATPVHFFNINYGGAG